MNIMELWKYEYHVIYNIEYNISKVKPYYHF